MWHITEVHIPINDDDIEGCRGCDRGEHSFEEIRRGIAGDDNRFRCGLERLKGLIPRQIEMFE